METRKTAKRLIKLAKKNPKLYSKEDVLYAKLIKKQDESKVTYANKFLSSTTDTKWKSYKWNYLTTNKQTIIFSLWR